MHLHSRIMSTILAMVMVLNLIMSLDATVNAVTVTKEYMTPEYTVSYSVDGKKASVTLTNTGKKPIVNWALEFDGIDGVKNCNNAVVYSNDSDKAVIRYSGEKSEIKPEGKTVFSFDVKASGAYPKRVKMLPADSLARAAYSVRLTNFKSTGSSYSGAVLVSGNNMLKINSWELSFDSNFNISRATGAKLTSSGKMKYKLTNKGSSSIRDNKSIIICFEGKGKVTDPKISNVVFNAYSKTAKTSGQPTGKQSASAEDAAVSTGTSGSAETTASEITTSETDVTEDPGPDPEDMEKDTDGDGLTDYYEDILGTDKNDADTDHDGLTDLYEVVYTGTDPTKADTDGNGKKDSEEDPDKDGLSNIQECIHNTDPTSKDTDADGLSDYDEIIKHKTDPLAADTDGDSIPDGDEITLKLDPNNQKTDGTTPDSEVTSKQTVDTKSSAFAKINNGASPFEVSVDIKAAGVADHNIYAMKSGYSHAIENTAIIGVAPEFDYTDSLKVEEMTVNFHLDSSITNNTLGTYKGEEFKGIKRLNVFMFMEDINMLMPIETFHDTATNTVSAKTDRMGTYCLVDMEIFLKNLGIEPSGEVMTTDSAEYNSSFDGLSEINSAGAAKPEALTSLGEIKAGPTTTSGYKDGFDVVFLIDTVGVEEGVLDNIKQSIDLTVAEIYNRSDDVTISFFLLNGKGEYYFRISWENRP